ncbi:unnamed protein product, partial [Didymodactylos carnosus]
EQNCYELEFNECNVDTKFRCTNGMCIDKTFSFDRSFDCMDRSDEKEGFYTDAMEDTQCFNQPSILCEEFCRTKVSDAQMSGSLKCRALKCRVLKCRRSNVG